MLLTSISSFKAHLFWCMEASTYANHPSTHKNNPNIKFKSLLIVLKHLNPSQIAQCIPHTQLHEAFVMCHMLTSLWTWGQHYYYALYHSCWNPSIQSNVSCYNYICFLRAKATFKFVLKFCGDFFVMAHRGQAMILINQKRLQYKWFHRPFT